MCVLDYIICNGTFEYSVANQKIIKRYGLPKEINHDKFIEELAHFLKTEADIVTYIKAETCGRSTHNCFVAAVKSDSSHREKVSTLSMKNVPLCYFEYVIGLCKRSLQSQITSKTLLSE